MTKQFIDFKPAVAENRWDLIKVLFTLRWRKKQFVNICSGSILK